MPTEYLPFEFLKNIRDLALEQFQQENPIYNSQAPSRYGRGTSEFYRDFNTAVRGIKKFDHVWVSRFFNAMEEAEENVQGLFKLDVSQSVINDLYEYINKAPLTKEICELERQKLRLQNEQRGKKEKTQELLSLNDVKDLEFGKTGVHIRCATANLKWLEFHLESIMKSSSYSNINEPHNKFQYIICTQRNVRYMNIVNRIDEYRRSHNYEISCDIEMKKIEDLFKNDKNLFELSIIGVPLVEDMVIYSNIPDSISQKLGRKSLLIRGIMNITDENTEHLVGDFLFPEEQRGEWDVWFNTIWNKITHLNLSKSPKIEEYTNS